jgi:uncharacterized protein (DUF58 family)
MNEQLHLDEEILSKAKGLYIEARKIKGELLTGHHKSKIKGKGTDFVELREYTNGDDIRDIDWKFYGRSEKLMVKVKEDKGRIDLLLCIDDSYSMDFGKNNKLEYAVRLAGTIGYLGVSQSDRVILKTFSGFPEVPPSPSKEAFFNFFLALAMIKPKCSIKPLKFLRDVNALSKNLKVLLFSDMLYEEKIALEFLSSLEGIEFDIIHIVADEEREIAGFEQAFFKDPEGDEKILVDPHLLNRYYRKAFSDWEKNLEEAVTENGGLYIRTTTSIPIYETVTNYLTRLGTRR